MISAVLILRIKTGRKKVTNQSTPAAAAETSRISRNTEPTPADVPTTHIYSQLIHPAMSNSPHSRITSGLRALFTRRLCRRCERRNLYGPRIRSVELEDMDGTKHILHDVLYAPESQRSLLSIAKLMEHHKFEIEFVERFNPWKYWRNIYSFTPYRNVRIVHPKTPREHLFINNLSIPSQSRPIQPTSGMRRLTTPMIIITKDRRLYRQARRNTHMPQCDYWTQQRTMDCSDT